MSNKLDDLIIKFKKENNFSNHKGVNYYGKTA